MVNDNIDGFAASPEAIDHYLGQIVNPALEHFEEIAKKLADTSYTSFATMMGHANLPGSREFTSTSRQMLDALFAAHRTLAERQRQLVQTVTRFRDNLQASRASYLHNEANQVQSMGNLSRQLETRLTSDGTTG